MTAELARSLEAMGIGSRRVLDAVARLDRARFVDPGLRTAADGDHPLPIGHGQTISQPFVVAYMTERLALSGDERVLEVGTGSGYQTALLALLARTVCSVEIIPELSERARRVLVDELGLRNVSLRVGDGAQGWPEAAPFDRVLVTAAGPEVPPPLIVQLAPGGRLMMPVGADAASQVLRVVDRREDGTVSENDLLPVRFVPLTHRHNGHEPGALR